MKKGDMTMQVVVLAALALIFLIIVVFVMTDKISIFSKTLDDCTNKDGICVNEGTCSSKGGIAGSFSCPKAQECCLNTCEAKDGTCTAEDTSNCEQIYLAGCPTGKVCCK